MSVLDNPVRGTISRYSEGTKEQHDPQIFADALTAALAHPRVVAVRWQQYTPYFNDGDPCVFHAWMEYGWKFVDTADDAGDYEDGFVGSYDLYDSITWEGDWKNRSATYHYGPEHDQGLHELVVNFETVLQNGHHYAMLNQKFGDPAQVTAYRDRFEVEYYEHD